MSFLKLLHGTKKKKDLFDIACDYDGYENSLEGLRSLVNIESQNCTFLIGLFVKFV